ncbi:DegQ family serine endoprotease [Rodentibacter pneumotropicus]|uniref:Periplasmic serine protease do/hhoA-like protein n=1 Tax=Rodentibacter pneumotropicus TaxID=758 RepID=A0A448MQM8_9PAST|nr:DegQ family serine endoprotease [Rodentibacter pneumotropicus]NBH75030.1 DegQ family serine endoprotease [Rodentibacter pneumotropicus]OOF64493.1 serine peptidase [Rodentibacter pneumotropicus]THA00403.1 DegQ family serine endoprotease [Rodentibacter pneumotropicus]THA05566.1 DegQ family serine endoprotease [Rodentibacter pneumotropicus]THA11706.1 DegQ family serine endoprotease [Rodentibacter pneumotropicus]
MKKRHFILSSIALGLGVLGTSVSTQANLPSFVIQQNSLAPMLEKVQPAVVTISVEGKAKNSGRSFLPDDIPEEFKFFFGDQFAEQFGNRGSGRHFRGLGSGVVINADKGYVLTNNHVINDADKINVALQDGREFKAKLVGKDEQSDIALIQIEKPSNLTALKFADSDKLRVGDFTVAIGNPFGLGQTVTSGIVSALGRSTGSDSGAYENYIQTDAAVNRGNSGGALVNLNGELIGINTAIISPSGGNAGIAFAIPSNQAHNIVQQILEFGEVRRGLLGIKGGELNADLAKAFNVNAQQGAFVSEVLPNSAAEKAGIKAGDVITAMNGQKISSFAEMRAKIATSGAGKEIELTYLRDGKSQNVKVKLQADDGKGQSASSIELRALDGAELNNYNAKGIKGIEISKVQPNSLAAQRGLKAGDIIIGVNRQAVESTQDLRKVLEEKPSAVALNILRGENNFYLLVQ